PRLSNGRTRSQAVAARVFLARRRWPRQGRQRRRRRGCRSSRARATAPCPADDPPALRMPLPEGAPWSGERAERPEPARLLEPADWRRDGRRTDFEGELQRTVTTIRKSCRAKEQASRRSGVHETNAIAQFVHSNTFTVLLGSLIVCSALLIGLETHAFSSKADQWSDSKEVSMAFSGLNYIITFLFTMEMAVRLYVFRLDFFFTERWWNLFDLAVLILALVEVAMELVVTSFGESKDSLFDSGGTAKMMRLVRLTRLLRLVRTFRQLKPLRMLVRSIMAAGKSVFWAFLLLIIIIFSFGVILTQAVTEHTVGGTQVEDENLISYYGDLVRSMMSLWMAVSGGISWIELTEPLEGTGNSVWTMMFLVYIFIVARCLRQTPPPCQCVFCQNAIEGAAADLDLTLDAQMREKQVHVNRLALLFHEMNENTEDKDMELTFDELQALLTKPKVQSWFRSPCRAASSVCAALPSYRIIDADESGAVSLEEFVGGCLQLRGPATRVDVEALKWDIGDQARGKAGPRGGEGAPVGERRRRPGRRDRPW
ncbi:unnamed protein product, partial [Prorocentrum cordatum]